MAIVATVMNMKGGVGKTTVSMHLGGALARYNFKGQSKPDRKVLLIDYDPQFNLTQAYLSAKKYYDLELNRKTIISVLQDESVNLDPYKLQVPCSSQPPSVDDLAVPIDSFKDGSCLDIVPSTLDLMYVALGRADTQIDIIETRFSKFISKCRKVYDLTLIDCHPAGSIMTKTALSNSDHVIIPVVPERYAVRGIGLMMDFINFKNGSNSPKPHILFNKVPRAKLSKEEIAIRANAKYSSYCMNNTMKKFQAYADPEEGRGFVWRSSKPYSKEAQRGLVTVAREFAEKVGIL